jgi:RimJ/RimL family protein N-acetyltransferase
MYCKLNSFERHYYTDHLKRLDSSDRYLRFSFLAKDEWIDNFVRDLDFSKHIIKVIFVQDKIVAAVHIALLDNDSAEIGISVDKTHRGRGWGHLLFDAAIEYCKNSNITKIETMCMNNNKWVITKMREYDTTFERDGSQTIAHAEIDKTVTFSERYGFLWKEHMERVYWYTNKTTQFLRTVLQN